MNTQPKLVKYKCGYCVWRLNGKLHREDGPAVTWASGNQQWYLNGKQYTYEKWCKRIEIIEKRKQAKQKRYTT